MSVFYSNFVFILFCKDLRFSLVFLVLLSTRDEGLPFGYVKPEQYEQQRGVRAPVPAARRVSLGCGGRIQAGDHSPRFVRQLRRL